MKRWKIFFLTFVVIGTVLYRPIVLYTKLPPHDEWQQMAQIYNAKSLRNDNVYIAPHWVKQWAMDWARFGMQVPIKENDLYNPPFNKEVRIWLFDYSDYYRRNVNRLEKIYEVTEYYKTKNIRAYVLSLK